MGFETREQLDRIEQMLRDILDRLLPPKRKKLTKEKPALEQE